MKYSVEEILTGVKNQDVKIIDYIYEEYFSIVKNYIVFRQGSVDDAKDIFQEVLLRLYEKARINEVNITTSFKFYFCTKCKLKWNRHLLKRKTEYESWRGYSSELQEESHEYEVLDVEEVKNKLFMDSFNKLHDDCKKILEMSFKKIPLIEIAKVFNKSNEKIIRNRKHYCKKALVEIIKEDLRYKYLKRYKDD